MAAWGRIRRGEPRWRTGGGCWGPSHDGLDAGLLARLPDGRLLGMLAPIHEAAGEDPHAIARLDGAAQQEQPPFDGDERAGGHLRVQVEDEVTATADQPFRLAGLEEAAAE